MCIGNLGLSPILLRKMHLFSKLKEWDWNKKCILTMFHLKMVELENTFKESISKQIFISAPSSAWFSVPQTIHHSVVLRAGIFPGKILKTSQIVTNIKQTKEGSCSCALTYDGKRFTTQNFYDGKLKCADRRVGQSKMKSSHPTN